MLHLLFGASKLGLHFNLVEKKKRGISNWCISSIPCIVFVFYCIFSPSTFQLL